MGNRSMFAKNKAQSNSLLNTAKIFYNSIRMEFEFYKMHYNHYVQRKVFRMKISL